MSNPKNWWYFVVIKVIRNYPLLREIKNNRQAQSTTVSYQGMPGAHSETNRKTEASALRQLSPREESDLHAVELAIEQILQMTDGQEVMAVVRLHHWQRLDFDTVGYMLHMSSHTARRRNGRFVKEVAKNLGYL